MNKRDFLAAAAIGGAAISSRAQMVRGGISPGLASPALLTVSGTITRGNRGPIDPLRDQMMVKQKLSFQNARVFNFETLTALPPVIIRVTLEYDNQPHQLWGPLLTDVLLTAGAPASGTLALRAVDGYSPRLTIADARKYRYIVATHLDGETMPLGGLGPLWAIYEADKFPEAVAKPLDQRFAACPWGLFNIDVQA